eukprot:5456241-Alexandrium_andersonii.AAC.1
MALHGRWRNGGGDHGSRVDRAQAEEVQDAPAQGLARGAKPPKKHTPWVQLNPNPMVQLNPTLRD